MPIGMNWRNIFTMVGLVAVVLSGVVAGTGVVIQWRIEAVQRQLSDRMMLFQREMDSVSRRLERLERP
jgi:hypothetical protein